MFLKALWSSLVRKSTSRPKARRDRRRRFFAQGGNTVRLRVESLEPRALLAVTATLTDNTSTGVGPGGTIHYTETISSAGTDALNVQVANSLDSHTTFVEGSVTVTPIAFNDAYSMTGNTPITISAAQGVLANDIDPDSATPLSNLGLTAISVDNTGTNGTAVLNTDGSFTFTPQTGFTGTTTFKYTTHDAQNLNSNEQGVVTMTITGLVWYVDSAAPAAGQDGSFGHPFQALTQLSAGGADPDGTGDTIFVYNTGGSASYSGGITLENNQTLIGDGDTLTVNGLAIGNSASDPTITNAAGNGVTLASGNTLKGFTVGDTSAYDISNVTTQPVGTLTITNVNLIGTGGLFRADAGGALTVTLDTATSTSTAAGIHGIQLAGALTGSFTATTGAISGGNATGTDVLINGGTETVSIGSSITSSVGGSVDIGSHGTNNVTLSGALNITGGTGISAHNNTGGTIAFNNASKIVSTGASNAVTLTGNTGATINFTGGGLDIDTTSSIGFSATGGGTLSVQGTGNTINATSGTALNVANTTISSSHLTFQSITSGTAANSGATGIILDTTGANGGLHVTGTGSAASGGTIQHKTGADGSTSTGIGIYLNSTTGVQLDRMQLNDFQNFGIRGIGVNGFTLANSTINTTSGFNGNSTALDEGTVALDNLTGTASITNSTISNAIEANAKIINTSGNLNLTVSGSTFSNNDPVNGLQGLLLQCGVNAGENPDIVANITTTNFSGNRARDLQAITNSAATMTINIGQNAVAGSGGNFSGMPAAMIDLAHNSTGNMSFNIQRAIFNVNVAPFASVPINIFNGSASGSGSTFQGRVVNNAITAGNNSGFDGITLTGSGPGTMTVLVDSNTVTNVASVGINYTGAQSSATNHTNLTITNNTVTMPDPNSSFGIQVSASASASATAVVEALISGNNVKNNTASPDYRVDARFAGATLQLPTYGGGSDTNNIKAFVAANNKTNDATSTSGEVSASLGIGNVGHFSDTPGSAAVPLPNNAQPLFFAPSLPEPPADEDTPPAAQPPLIDDSTREIQPPVVEPPIIAPPVGVRDGILSQDELSLLVNAAIARWEATGLTSEQSGLLRSVVFEVTNLGGRYLGQATPGHVTLDDDGAANGWFIDTTPFDDSEYKGGHGQDARATHTVDALTTVMHELGHQLGLDDTYSFADSGNLMYGYLTLGTRRLPTVGQAEGAVPDGDASPDYVLSPITIGTLPAGKSVTIRFDATVNGPNVAAGVNSVSAQGTVTGTGINLVTNDPDTAAPNDATVTVINAQPDFQITSFGDGVTSAAPGDTLTYTLAYTNAGNQDATGVFLTETLPAGTTIDAASTAAGWTQQGATSTYKLTLGNLAATATGSKTFIVHVTSPAPAGVESLVNSATIDDDHANGADPTAANNLASDTDTLAASPNLAITKSDGNIPGIPPGGSVTYTLNFSNIGNQDATGVVLHETVPAGTTFNALASSVGWLVVTPGSGGPLSAGSTYRFSVPGTLAGNGGTGTVVNFAVTADNPFTGGNQISNTATIDYAVAEDSDLTNNTSTDTTPITDTVSVATVAMGDETADEAGDKGLFTFKRTVSTVLLTADFELNDASTAGALDYTLALASGSSGSVSYDNNTGIGTVTFPVGVTTVSVQFTAPPEAPQAAEAAETVTLNVLAQAGVYVAGSPNNATVTIAQNGFIVVNTNDAGEGSLRQAILNSNAISGTDTITFTGSTFTDATPDTITLTSGELVIDSNLRIEGTGANLLKLSGNHTSRVLRETPGSTATVVGLTIADGNGIGGVANRSGGGILNEGTLTLRSVVISGNSANLIGGGIESLFAALTLINCSVIDNAATGPAGGISISGIPNTLIIVNSTIANNSSGEEGGAIRIVDGTATITNSTISGNSSVLMGGGIANIATLSGSLTVINSTVTGNRSASSAGGIFASGTETLSNTIVAGNFKGASPSTTPSDIEGGTINTANNNLIGDAGTAGGITHDADGNPAAGNNNIVGNSGAGTIVIGTVLAPLVDNGGPTQTHALVGGSPAINAGSNALIPADTFDLDADGDVAETLPFDQRDTPFKRVVGATVDIGAFESLGHPWHNDLNPLDVVGSDTVTPDDHVVAGDALAIINYINAFGPGPVPALAALGQPYGFLDTADGSGDDVADNFVAANDVLAVINAINAGLGGEGEPAAGLVGSSRPAEHGAQPLSSNGQFSLNELIGLLALDVASQPKRRSR